MAKILFGGGVAEIRGSEAGTTFSRNKGGAYTRQRVSPVQPQTSFQLAQRELFTSTSKRWGGVLTQSQRDAWEAFAQLFPVIDVFGRQLFLTGEQSYIKINTRVFSSEGAFLDDPPADQDVGVLESATVTASTGPDLVEFGFAPAQVPPTALRVFAAPLLPVGRSFVKNLVRLVTEKQAGIVTPFDATFDYTSRFGALIAGQKLITLTFNYNPTNGAVTSPLRSETVVT